MWYTICWMFAIRHPARIPLWLSAFTKAVSGDMFKVLSIMKSFFSGNSWKKLLNGSIISCVLVQHNTTQHNTQVRTWTWTWTVHCTVHLRGQIDTHCTWSQHQLSCGQVLQIAELIDCFYNKHTSFTICSGSGIKIELAPRSPSRLQSSPQPANTFPPSTTVISGSAH